MLKKILGLFSEDISIDLGTANTIIYAKGRGIVLNEPSVVAIKHEKGVKRIVAVGTDAKKMMGKTPGSIEVIRPLRDGVIADLDAAEKMIQHFIKQTHTGSLSLPCPRVLICVPAEATHVEKKAIKESGYSAGAREVYIIAEPIAAALGAGLKIAEPKGSMIVDIGGGTSEIAMISLNGIVASQSVRVGGDKFDEAIINHVRRVHGVAIGESTAERIKKEVGSAFKGKAENKQTEVRGRNIAEGVPRQIAITAEEILVALQEPLESIITGVLCILEQSPPELSSDVVQDGMMLTGGGALLKGLDALICSRTGVPVYIAEEPLNCVAEGGGIALNIIDKELFTEI